MKSGDQSIGWSTEIDFEYSNTEYTMGLRTVSGLDFPKMGSIHDLNLGAASYYHAVSIFAAFGISVCSLLDGQYTWKVFWIH